MAGFDSQFTGSASHTYLVADLMRFLEEIGSPLVQAEEWASYQSHLIRVLEATDQSAKPAQHERDRFHEMTKRIVAEAQAARHRDASFWSQMAESISAYATDLWMERSFTSPRMNNSRDAQMARNLLWLINHQYRGRKIIVWAATFHAVRDIQGVRPSPGLGLPPDLYDGVVVTGHHLHQALGNQMFVLGFIAHSGQYGRFYEAPKPLAPPPPDSLEALLHNAGFEHAILDLRSSSSPGDWLRSSFVSRPLGYAPMEARWSRVMDAVFYSRTMTPSTRAP
jgi:erythromycin esterase